MSRSMIQRRQAAERERIESYEATLKRAHRVPRLAPDIERALAEAISGFESDVVRPVEGWRPKLKTRDSAKLRLAAARHLFARFAVPSNLEAIWLDSDGLSPEEAWLRRHWYIVAARGGSLYKEGAGEWLSRKEVHRLLNPPGALSFDEALWHAVARSYTDNAGMALRIARSRIATTSRSELGFWREVVQFFCANGTSREAIDDLCDFLVWKRGRHQRFCVRGRTLGSLSRMMSDWHRDLGAIARIEAARRRAEAAACPGAQFADGGRWRSSALEDWSWQPASKAANARREEYVVRQLRTAEALVEETRAMHHCVSTYAQKCIAGHASIWSLARRVAGRDQRMLTIEVDRNHRAVQVRGLGNRLPTTQEVQILTRWAKARGIHLMQH